MSFKNGIHSAGKRKDFFIRKKQIFMRTESFLLCLKIAQNDIFVMKE